MWFSSSDDNTPSVIAPYPRTDSVGIFHYYAAQISYNNNCLSEKTSIDVTVKSCCDGTLFVPSAFTPNQDGINDVLHIVKAPEFVVSEFTVYDRWGRLVFQSSNAKTGWDGTIGGEPADMGTYYYSAVVNCTNSDKKPLNLKGDVILIR
jgi:gliding motility-associated-like protein